MNEMDSASASRRPLAKRQTLGLAGGGGVDEGRLSPPAGAQFTAIAHFQPAGRAGDKGLSRQQSAASNSISSSASERDELETSSNSFAAPSGHPGDTWDTATQLDRMKALEELTLKRVAESTLEAEAGHSEQAVRLAREAMETLNKLRLVVLEEQRVGSAGSAPADQAEGSSNQQQETPPMSSGVNLFDLLVMAKSNLAAQLRQSGELDESLELYTQLCKLASNKAAAGARQSARFLLYRFGLQMGNVLLELGEPARALKHFRLTLDRLSGSAQQQAQLRAKLMSNIAIALLALGAQQKQKQQQQQQQQQRAMAPPDHLGAMQRLLSDNLLTSASNASLQQKRQLDEPLNANHHRFGLNLVASWHGEQADGARTMRSTLSSLLKVEICHQFARVLPDGGHSSTAPGADQKHDSSSSSSCNIRERTRNDDGHSSAAPTAHARDLSAPASTPDQRRWQQVMSATRADKLERTICERRDGIRRALLASCALIIDQAAGTGGEPLVARPQGKQSSELTSAGRRRRALAATSQCIKLLAGSDLYGQLASELRLNNVLGELAVSKRKLRSAMRSLVEVARDAEQRAGAPGPKTKVASMAAANERRPSPMVATNVALLCTAAGQLARALAQLNGRERALGQNGSASSEEQCERHINLANCHVALKEFERAEVAVEQALDVEPASWLANYNALLIARLAGRHLDELPARTRKLLGGGAGAQLLESEQPRALAKLAVAQLQLALLYKQSGMEAKSAALFERLAGGACAARLAPEVSLQASRATTAADEDEAALAMLKAANQRHAYHTPTAERLVALHISRFQYREAELLLAHCLRNRPDQARWLQLLAECHRRAAHYAAAIRVYKHAMRLFPLDTGCLRALAKLADELGLTDERELSQTRLKTISESRAKLEAATAAK